MAIYGQAQRLALGTNSFHDAGGSSSVKESVRISFPVSESWMYPEFDGNRRYLDSLDHILNSLKVDTNATVLSVSVHGYGSIDGPYRKNEQLSRERADSVVAYLLRRNVLQRDIIAASNTAEDWEGFTTYVENATQEQLPHREGILNIIASNRTPDGKEWAIKQMYPTDYRVLVEHCLPKLRRTVCQVDYVIKHPVVEEPVVEKQEAAVVDTLQAEPAQLVQSVEPVQVMEEKKGFWNRLALKTNLLYDAALIPNIGIEMDLGRQWTACFDWFHTWLSSNDRHRYWQGYGGYLTVRRYLSRQSPDLQPYSLPRGHHLGAYVLGMTYDVEWGGRGYQADRFGFGGGLEYGYSMPIGRRLDLDFSLGIGFQDGEYKEYVPSNDSYNHYIWQSTHKRHWFGPTKAEVTLRWNIGVNKKGGNR